ncbi:hypothetical protein [Actinoplanes sp. NPDC020271]|uniref:hypothetical protein n=1 Tax=Actinoplanes sp. NPDC020271 TaxID=3363896 RepID=UPI0037B98141
MSLDVLEAPPATPALTAPPVMAAPAVLPAAPARPAEAGPPEQPHRHTLRRHTLRRHTLRRHTLRRHRRPRSTPSRIADRLWRPLLGLAAVIFAACGPAHALGNTDLVFNAVLVGLALSAFAVPLGMIGLRAGDDETEDDESPRWGRPASRIR